MTTPLPVPLVLVGAVDRARAAFDWPLTTREDLLRVAWDIGVNPDHARPPGSCGDCDACCVAWKIEALAKPAGAPCAYLDSCSEPGKKCRAYDERPGSCSGFFCAYVSLVLPEERYRPDRLGAIVYRLVPGTAGYSGPWGKNVPPYVVKLLREDVRTLSGVEKVVRKLDRRTPTIVERLDGSVRMTYRGEPMMLGRKSAPDATGQQVSEITWTSSKLAGGEAHTF